MGVGGKDGATRCSGGLDDLSRINTDDNADGFKAIAALKPELPICNDRVGDPILKLQPMFTPPSSLPKVELNFYDWYDATGGSDPILPGWPNFLHTITENYFLSPPLSFFGVKEHKQCGTESVGSGLDVNCITNATVSTFGFSQGAHFTRSRLRPQLCSPNARSPLMANVYPPYGACNAAAQLSQALSMACVISQGAVIPVDHLQEPPTLGSKDDAAAMARWVQSLQGAASQVVSTLYLDSVPKRVLAPLASNQGSDTLKGAKGKEIVGIYNDVRTLANQWSVISQQLGVLAGVFETLQPTLELIEDELRDTQIQLKIQMFETIKGMIQDVANAVSSWGFAKSFNPVGGAAQSAASAAKIGLSVGELGLISDREDLAEKIKNDRMSIALDDATLSARGPFGELQRALAGIQTSAFNTVGAAGAVSSAENEAQYQAAKAAGMSMVVIDGQEVDLPMNTVLAQQFDIYKKRYEAVSLEARYMAYLARLAIEQRIAMRLEDIDVAVGNLEAPSIWADDICLMKGVDLRNKSFSVEFSDEQLLRSFTPEKGIEQEIADAAKEEATRGSELLYIGDYVNRLENFVSFYNLEYPSKDAADVAVLSLTQDLLQQTGGTCPRPSSNLLYYSGDLTGSVPASGAEGLPAWRASDCDAAGVCLTASDAAARQIPPPAALTTVPEGEKFADSRASGATWLEDYSLPSGVLGVPVDSNVPAAVPPRSVYQSVTLEAGAYLLSWWDRGVLGAMQPYRVNVFREDGEMVGGISQVPAAGEWSERNVLALVAPTAGTYHVVFGASSQSQGLGSVAIGDVQLERSTAQSAEPTSYEYTEADRLIAHGKCSSSAMLSKAFQRFCALGRCWYELTTPVAIDTGALESGFSPLSKRFATGNFNFRHVDTAINVVGTGVIDCSRAGDPTCYSNAYLEYSLDHVAYDVELFDHNGSARHFNFGEGNIRNAKALTSERVITQPMSAADQELLKQPQFTKTELGGRPLSGIYRFRIYDNPALDWSRIEDIQFILSHRYWSRVERSKSRL
jgi:hypothetical protein